MTDAAGTLESLLGDYYRAAVMGRATPQSVLLAYDAASDADPALEPLARAALTDLKRVHSQRCVITATKVEFLTQALNR